MHYHTVNSFKRCCIAILMIRDLHKFVFSPFLSRVSRLTRDIDIAILSVRLSVCPSVSNTLVLYENGLTYRHSFFTVR